MCWNHRGKSQKETSPGGRFLQELKSGTLNSIKRFSNKLKLKLIANAISVVIFEHHRGYTKRKSKFKPVDLFSHDVNKSNELSSIS